MYTESVTALSDNTVILTSTIILTFILGNFNLFFELMLLLFLVNLKNKITEPYMIVPTSSS